MTHIYRRLLLSVTLLSSTTLLTAQSSTPWNPRVDSLAPGTTHNASPAPKTSAASLTMDTQDGTASQQITDSTILTPALKGVVLVGDTNAIVREGIQGVSGLELRGVTPPEPEALDALLAPYFGNSLSFGQANTLATQIAAHYSEHDNPLVYVVLPPMQKIAHDTVQILVVEGTVGTIHTEGNTYTEATQLLHQMTQQAGESLHTSILQRDLVWLNTNTRQVDILAGKGSEPRTADITLKVEETKPWSVYGGFSDTGNKLTGRERWNLGTTHSNLWKRDHQAGYQYSQGNESDEFFSHFVSYTLPLHQWKHTIRAFGNYSESRTKFTRGGLTSNTKGENRQFGVRYSMPIVLKETDKRNFVLGMDYKKSDSAFDFTFFGTPLSATPTTTETVQFVAGYDHYQIISKQDGMPGSFSFSAMGYASPGGLTDDNDQAAFRASNPQADPSYAYGKIEANRVFILKQDWLLNLRGSAQYSADTLLGGEQFSITGDGFVRGYDPSEATGDFGYLASAELWTPTVSVFEKMKNSRLSGDRLQGLAFTDYGYTGLQNPNGSDPNIEAWGVGTGIRWSLGDHLSLKVDYAWQLKDTGASDIFFSTDNSRAHISLRMSW